MHYVGVVGQLLCSVNYSQQIVRAGVIFENLFERLLTATNDPRLTEPSILIKNSGRL